MRFIIPVILIAISVGVFFTFTNPLYNSIRELRSESTSYNEALGNSKMLENERDKLTAKYNAIDPNNLLKIQKLLPDNIDNIRLILEIEQIAAPYGMVLKDVRYNSTSKQEAVTPGGAGAVQGGIQKQNKDYGVWDLEFSTTGTYNNFLNFTKDLESNLRIVDISSIQFSSDSVSSVTKSGSSLTPSPDTYRYNFKIKTYWLKN